MTHEKTPADCKIPEVPLMSNSTSAIPQDIPTAPPTPDPPSAWLVMCLHCGQGTEVPLPFNRDSLARFLARLGWYVSVLTPPGQPPEVPVLFAALCTACAQTISPPATLKAAEEYRQRLLQGPP